MLAMVVLAMAALAMPALANAPVVKSLPIIIIGDEDPGDNDGTLYLMRYNDILNWADTSYVLWNNASYTTDAFHVYMLPLAGSESSPTASTDVGLVTNLTNAAYVDLVNSAVLPPASMDITYWNSASDNFFSLSLIDQYINQMAATPMTDSYSANAATNGVNRAATYGTEFIARNDVLFVAAVSSGTTKAVVDAEGGGASTIWTVAGSEDDQIPTGARLVFTSPPPSSTWWNGTPFAFYPGTTQAQTTTSGDGVGYQVNSANATLLTYGTWQLLLGDFSGFVIPHDGGGGLTAPVLEFLATLESDASSPAMCPGWRFFISNSGLTHAVVPETGSTPTGHLAAPYAGNPYVARAYVATPYALTEMADDRWISKADWFGAGHPDENNDGRNYSFAFDLMHAPGAADRGTFLITALEVYAFDAPDPGTVLKSWQGAGAFNTWVIEDWEVLGGGPGEFWQGAFAIAGDKSWIEMWAPAEPRGNTRRLKKATSGFFDRAPFSGNTLVRKNTTLGSEIPDKTPVIQLITFVFSSSDELRGNAYYDVIGPFGGDRGKPQTKADGFAAGGVPNLIATPDVVSSYHWMPEKVHEEDAMIVQVQVYSQGSYGTTAWGDDTGRVRLIDTVIEEVALP